MSITKFEIARRVDVLASNGEEARAQEIIAPIGYTPTELERGKAFAQAWRSAHSNCSTLLGIQRDLYDVKKAKKRTAERELRRLRNVLQGLWPGDPMVNRVLDTPVRMKQERIEGSDGTRRSAVNATTYSALILKWRGHLQRAQALPTAYQDALALRGWDTARFEATLALVEDFENSDEAHSAAMGRSRTSYADSTKAFKVMERWYALAVRLIRDELLMEDPNNSLGLKEKLKVSFKRRNSNSTPAVSDPAAINEGSGGGSDGTGDSGSGEPGSGSDGA